MRIRSLFTAQTTLGTDKGPQSVLRAADLIDASGATNIAGDKFDSPSNHAAPKEALDSSITSTAHQTFVQYISSTQLTRFGLHNDGVLDQQLIATKWEALALAPVYDRNAKDDYFLFTLVTNYSLTLQLPLTENLSTFGRRRMTF